MLQTAVYRLANAGEWYYVKGSHHALRLLVPTVPWRYSFTYGAYKPSQR
jgi:hypothetical protein